jgi:hypothetical protein
MMSRVGASALSIKPVVSELTTLKLSKLMRQAMNATLRHITQDHHPSSLTVLYGLLNLVNVVHRNKLVE